MARSQLLRYRNPSALERGASLVEYGLVVALISVLALAGVRSLGDATKEDFTCVGLNINGIPCVPAGVQGQD
jgi:Flp pilus assembly pilin Flp